METIYMNTGNSKTNEPHRFNLTLADKLNLKNSNKNMALANLSITHGKTLILHKAIINLKYLPQLGMMILICVMDHILVPTFISSTLVKNMKLSSCANLCK